MLDTFRVKDEFISIYHFLIIINDDETHHLVASGLFHKVDG